MNGLSNINPQSFYIFYKSIVLSLPSALYIQSSTLKNEKASSAFAELTFPS
jgi:hypothetical protein